MIVAIIVGVSIGWCGDLISRKVSKFFSIPHLPRLRTPSAVRSMYLIRGAVGVSALLLNSQMIIYYIGHRVTAVNRSLPSESVLLFVMCNALFGMVPIMLCFSKFLPHEPLFLFGDRDPIHMYRRYMTRNTLFFFLGELFRCMLGSAILYLGLFGFIAYFLPAFFAVILLVMIPVYIVLFGIVFLANLALRRGSALCLGVTLLTTITSCALFVPCELSGARLGALALMTGLSSGCLTELLRRGFIAAAPTRELLRKASQLDAEARGRAAVDYAWSWVNAPFVSIFGGEGVAMG